MKIAPALPPTRGPNSIEVSVEVTDLVKEFRAPGGGTLRAVDRVSFDVQRGEVFGFLGPNGAGKTTTLEIIEGLQSPTSGRTSVFGLDSQRDRNEMKKAIGVQLQWAAYFNFLTLEEILDLFGSFFPKRLSPDELLDKVGLSHKRKAQVQQLSGGQAQRFSIIAAMVNDAEVLFLDEPTTGLDPQARRNLWDLVTYINREGKTVVLTTHYMEEAEVLCDRVAIIDHGRIQALDTPLGLVQGLDAAYRVQFHTARPLSEDRLRGLPTVVDIAAWSNGANGYQLAVADTRAALSELLHWAERDGLELNDLRVVPATLEDVFLSLTGRTLRE